MTETSDGTIDRVDVGIVVAMSLEAAAIAERLGGPVSVWAAGRRVTVGRFAAASVAVVTAGVGGDAAVQGVRLLAAGHRPGRLFAAGLCGGLDPGVARDAIVVADRVGRRPSCGPSVGAASEDHRWLPVDLPPRNWEAGPAPARVRGPLVTSDGVVATAAAKRAMHAATGGLAVDMESWWIVHEARRHDLPVHVVRAVCDTAEEDVPRDIASLATAGSTARLAGAAVRMLWNRPAAAIDLVELRERAHAAAEALARSLEAMIGGSGAIGGSAGEAAGRRDA